MKKTMNRAGRISAALLLGVALSAGAVHGAAPKGNEPVKEDIFVSGPEDATIPGAFKDLAVLPRPKDADPATLPRIEGKPDFTGVWFTGLHGYVTPSDREIAVPLTPAYQKIRDERRKATEAGTPPETSSSQCLVFGMPTVMNMAPLEFIMSPHAQKMTIVSQELRDVRHIYIDGRGHPNDPDPTFEGHSVAHWDGDVLVIDTIGTKGNLVGFDGIKLSEQAHIVERIWMPNPDGLINEITIRDPEALQKPWRNREYYKRLPKNTEIMEYVCSNNRDPMGIKGKPHG